MLTHSDKPYSNSCFVYLVRCEDKKYILMNGMPGLVQTFSFTRSNTINEIFERVEISDTPFNNKVLKTHSDVIFL